MLREMKSRAALYSPHPINQCVLRPTLRPIFFFSPQTRHKAPPSEFTSGASGQLSLLDVMF